MKLEAMHPNLPILLFCMTADDFTHHFEHGFNIFDISMIFRMDMQRYVNFNMIVSCLSWASQNV